MPRRARRRAGPRKGKIGPLPLVIAGLTLVLIGPVVFMVFATSLQPGSSLPFSPTPRTIQNYVNLLTDPLAYRLIWNTIKYVSASLAMGMSIAVFMVWLTERTDMPLRNAIPALLFIPLAIPSALNAMGWVLLMSARTGYVNSFLMERFGWGPIDIYTFGGMVWVTGIGIVPSMYFMLSASFRNMDSQLEDAGRASGASTAKVARRVTLPLMLPSLAAAGIYYAILLAELFEIPLVLGFNANFRVLSIHVYELVRPDSTLPRFGEAAAFGVLTVFIGIGLAMVYMNIAKRAYKYAVVKGQRQAPRRIRLGRWRWAAVGFVLLYLTLSDILPMLAMAWTSLFPRWTAVTWDNLVNHASLEMYRGIFGDRRWGAATKNTIMLVLVASTTCVLLATLISWTVVRTKHKVMRYLDALAFLPRAIPAVVLALGVLMLSMRTPLYATIWVIVFAHTINYLPYCVRLINSTLLQLHQELEEASRASGANPTVTLIRVVFPLMRRAIVNCWLWVAAHSARDFTYALVLASAQSVVVSSLLWQSWYLGRRAETSAMSIMLVTVLVIFVVPLRYRMARSERV